MKNNISTAFKFNEQDAKIAEQLLIYEGHPDPEAIHYFAKHCDELTNYGYWFLLSTLWVWGGDVDINLSLWRELLSSNRPDKEISLMKPDELKQLKRLPNKIRVYRASQNDHADGIAYTTDFKIATEFALMNHSEFILTGRVKKPDVTALFLRQVESELIILDKSLIRGIEKISVKTIKV